MTKKWNIEEGTKRVGQVVWVLYGLLYFFQYNVFDKLVDRLTYIYIKLSFASFNGMIGEILIHLFWMGGVPYLIFEGIKFVYEGFKKK